MMSRQPPRSNVKTDHAAEVSAWRERFEGVLERYLPAEQREAIQNALNETFSAEIHVRFVTEPALISGIELTTNGQKVSWSIADYLVSVEKGVEELLIEKDKPKATDDPKLEDAKAEPEKSMPEQGGNENGN